MIPRIALAGIQTAQFQFVKSADRVVNAMSAPVVEPTDTNPVPPVAGANQISTPSTAYIASEDVYLEETVNMITAEQAYKANIAVFKTWDEMTEEVISALSK